MSKLTRRNLLATAAVAATAGIAGGFVWRHRPRPGGRPAHTGPPAFRDPAFPNPLRLPGDDGLFGVAEAAGSFTLVAKPVQQAIFPGDQVYMFHCPWNIPTAI